MCTSLSQTLGVLVGVWVGAGEGGVGVLVGVWVGAGVVGALVVGVLVGVWVGAGVVGVLVGVLVGAGVVGVLVGVLVGSHLQISGGVSDSGGTNTLQKGPVGPSL